MPRKKEGRERWKREERTRNKLCLERKKAEKDGREKRGPGINYTEKERRLRKMEERR